MKKIFFILIVIASAAKQTLSQGTWTQKADVGYNIRSAGVGFSIGTKGYIGLGSDYDWNMNFIPLVDFWEWDQTTNAWTQKANFPGPWRQGAVGFSIGNQGYVGTGLNGGATVLKDFWEWNQNTNIWTQKNDFPGLSRTWATGFSLNNKGYLGTGGTAANPITNYKDFWEYDPATDSWIQKSDFAGVARAWAVGFSIGNKGYIGANRTSAYQDLWEWDALSDTWSKKDSFPESFVDSKGFSIYNKGYIISSKSWTTSCWEWDQATDIWTEQDSCPFYVYYVTSVVFNIGAYGYLGTGSVMSNCSKQYWEFAPVGSKIEENEFENSISVYPNPTKGKINLKISQFENLKMKGITIYNAQGEKIYSADDFQINTSSNFQIDLSSQPKGIYFIHISSGNKTAVKKLVISN